MNSLQTRASNPETSIWVSASAGTGKTKILTDRVLRLLLSGTGFNKILCLTFTNAAAGEMKERVADSLAKWSSVADIELEDILYKTLGRKSSISELKKARQLYGLYLKADERINIQTIHSFCQSLLKKFPLESSISPSFKIIDETKSHIVLQQIKKDLLNKPELELINEYLAANFHEITIDEILSEIIKQKIKFLDSKNIVDDVRHESEKILSKLQENHDYNYRPIIQHSIICDLVGLDISAKQLKEFFLTQDGQKKKRIVTKKVAPIGSSLYSDLEYLQEQIYLLDQAEKTSQLKYYSQLLGLLSGQILSKYESYKYSKGLLDYDDLIIYTSKLLKSSDAKEWVLYKLDGGIDHLLVDEAQDTSADQWKIVEAMIEEFHAGDSVGKDTERTVFVVGDEKQSIFSFQGADVASFSHMNSLLKQKMLAGGNKFEDINLATSYRSAKEILDVVHHVFDRISKQMPSSFTSTLTKLEPFRTKHSGSVELWPLCVSQDEDDDFWKISTHDSNNQSTKIELAKKISQYIKDQLATNKVLPATGKAITSGDFMILFRKRDELTTAVMKSLKEDGLEVAGLDRIYLSKNLAVLDLLSAAKFVINMHDDLNLAALLKSPLIALSEEELHDIATSRGKSSIWQHICSSESYQDLTAKLRIFIDLFNRSDLSNFFQYIVDMLGYREALNASCGPDSNDAIDELLYACVDYAAQNDSSIQNFIFWLENYDESIKRDSSSSDKIRIMTLHAAKGLQAPIVILCDTNNTPANSERFLWDKNGQMLSAKNSTYVPEYYKELKNLKQNQAYAEYLRLLYVGMTRAEDHLVICGYQGGKKLPENCWYELARQAMLEIGTIDEQGNLVYGQESNIDKKNSSANVNILNIESFSPCSINKLPEFKQAIKDQKIHSPLHAKDPMGYGLVFHKIMEDSVTAKNLALMQDHPLIKTLDSKSQKRICASIDKICANTEFAKLIAKDCKTEVTIGTRIELGIKIGRIDLLVFDKNEIVIIDYKSDIMTLYKEEDVPENYKQQLLLYRQLIEKTYPGKIVRAMILWLQNGSLKEII